MKYSVKNTSDEVYNDDIEIIRIIINDNVAIFSDAIEKIYSTLKEDYLSLKQEYENSLIDEKIENIRLLKMRYSELIYEKSSLIPQFIYRSLFLSIYSFYESLLFIDFMRNVLKVKAVFTRDEFKNALVNKQINVSLDKFNIYGRIRNSFVHRHGRINQALEKSLIEFSTVSLSSNRLYINKIQFIKDFLHFMNDLVNEILTETERKYFNRKN